MGLKEFCVIALAAVLWQNNSLLCQYFLIKLTEQVPDFWHPNLLYSFQNARQVGLCLLPIVPDLQYHTWKVLDM